jgi:AraC family transcriptional activator of pobA
MNYAGYTCRFSEDFFKASDHSESLQHSPLFKIGGTPVLKITEQQRLFLNTLFQKMIDEQKTDYAYKDDSIRNYINLIIHEALKLQPSENYHQQTTASSRVTNVFFELLERQLPIESTDKPLQLKSAQDYAKELSIHPNYLNRAVKEVSGKPTTTHITERIVNEAKTLFQNTNWNIADIAYAIGFEYPTYFNNFFKKANRHQPKDTTTTTGLNFVIIGLNFVTNGGIHCRT